jgi:4-amino-4-deoxy-L-arabinose transferase-like glycosyltransferase
VSPPAIEDPKATRRSISTMRLQAIAALSRWSHHSLWISVVLSVLLGVILVIYNGSTLHFPDEQTYVAIANNLAAHGRFSINGVRPTAHEAPGWPLFLGLLRVFGGNIVVFRLANVAFAAASVAAGWWLAGRVGGDAAATLAAPALAIYPLSVYTTSTLYPQTMGTALMLGGLVCTVKIRETRHRVRWALLGGAIFGLLILTVTDLVVAIFVAAIWLAFGRPHFRLAMAVLLASAVAVVSVWIVRDELTMHAFIPVADNNGYNLLLANSAHASIRAGVDTNIAQYLQGTGHEGEVALDNSLRRDAVDWIKANPGRAATLYVERVADYFAPYDDLATKAQESSARNALATITYIPLLILFIWRLGLWGRRRPKGLEKVMIWLYLSDALVDAIFVTRVRYRVPLDAVLIIVIASMIAWKPLSNSSAPRGLSVSADPT